MTKGNDNSNSGNGLENSAENQAGGPLSKILPPDRSVWGEARRLVADKSHRVEDLATACIQDPVIVLELLKVSNAMFFSGGRGEITAVRTALVRLGADVVIEQLDGIGQRASITNKEVERWFAIHRRYAKRVSMVSTIIAQAVSRSLSDDCQTSALFINIGEMLAVLHFADEYVELANDNSRSGVNYQLATNYKFDVDKMGLKYLKKMGIPDSITSPLDRDNKPRSADRAIIRPICFSAAELVDAFDNNRWEKFAPGKTIPSKSSIRLLDLDDNQYLKVYERVAEYLHLVNKADEQAEKKQRQALASEAIVAPIENLTLELDDLIKHVSENPEIEIGHENDPPATTMQTVDYSLVDPNDQFGLSNANVPKNTPRVTGKLAERIQPPKLRTNKGTKTVANITSMFDDAASSEELLISLLDRLITEGPFEKSALIVVSKDRLSAVVVAARGPNIGNGQRISITDPLSPLARCFSKVRSWGSGPNESSPFGSGAFALAPIQADHDTPVALYADCGNNASLTFEARRIFRIVVDILNEKLPSIPGGIPIELRP